jgi:hypothetical protein
MAPDRKWGLPPVSQGVGARAYFLAPLSQGSTHRALKVHFNAVLRNSTHAIGAPMTAITARVRLSAIRR